jgi:hypothetical protein
MSLENAVLRSLERSAVRTRESGVTHAAWRMEIDSEAGGGAITLIDASEGPAFYRGEGVFLGWTQEQLAETYQRLLSPGDDRPFEVMQMG